MLPLYIHRDSAIHRLSAELKLFISLIGSAAIFFVEPLWLLAIVLLCISGLYTAARLPLKTIAIALRPVLIVAAIILVLQMIVGRSGRSGESAFSYFGHRAADLAGNLDDTAIGHAGGHSGCCRAVWAASASARRGSRWPRA